jgi:DNA polymerase-1
MDQKLILIDGSSVLSSCFYGTVPKDYYKDREQSLSKLLKTPDGVFTNGVYAMTRALVKIINQQQPSHLAVAWDVSRNTFRKALYPQYKATRKETPEELKSQYILMQDFLRAANILQFMDWHYEADDFLGSLAKRFENQIPVYIHTKDQDALQLVTENTRLWLRSEKIIQQQENIPDGSIEFTPDLVKKVYGVNPSQFVDLKALVGDSSDNIPGVRGVGPKVATPLIQEYGTVENLYKALEGLSSKEQTAFKEHCKSIGISRLPLKALLQGKESAILSKRLAKIFTGISACSRLTLGQLELRLDYVGFNSMCKKLQFKNINIRSNAQTSDAEQAALF